MKNKSRTNIRRNRISKHHSICVGGGGGYVEQIEREFHPKHPVLLSTHPLHMIAVRLDTMIDATSGPGWGKHWKRVTEEMKPYYDAFDEQYADAKNREVILSLPNHNRDIELVSDPNDDGPNFKRLLRNVSRKHSSENLPCKCASCLLDSPILHAAIEADEMIGTSDENEANQSFQKLMRSYNMPEESESDRERIKHHQDLVLTKSFDWNTVMRLKKQIRGLADELKICKQVLEEEKKFCSIAQDEAQENKSKAKTLEQQIKRKNHDSWFNFF
jgi:hypothetical protein